MVGRAGRTVATGWATNCVLPVRLVEGTLNRGGRYSRDGLFYLHFPRSAVNLRWGFSLRNC